MGRVVPVLRWVMKMTPDSVSDPRVVGCVRLLTIIGYANAATKWYVGKVGGRQELPPHEWILSLALLLSATGEAVTLYKKLKHDQILALDPTWPKEVQEHWGFLSSPQVEVLHADYLKAIRDKVTFHADRTPVEELLTYALASDQEVAIWTTSKDDPGGYPDVSANVVGHWLYKHHMHDPSRAELCAKTYSALWEVAAAALSRSVSVRQEPDA